MKNKIFLIALILIALVLGRIFLSHIDKRKSEAQLKASMRSPSVTVAEVEAKDMRRQFTTTARVASKYRVEVLARINGYLVKSYFKEGDYVKAGQLLFEIEPQEYIYAVNKTKANLKNAESQYAYYEKQLARYEELVAKDYIARSEYDNILSQRDALKAQVESAKSAYRDAQRNLSYTKVKAPVDGRVGFISVTVGNYVSASSGALTTINSCEPMYVVFPLDSKEYAELVRIDKSANVKREVEFIFSSGEKYDIKGVQDFRDNKIDATTGTITMRATFPNPHDALIQGDFGRVIIYTNSEDKVAIVPQEATMENQEGRYVYVLDEKGLPKISYIKTMGLLENNWIIQSGVNIGDRVITSGLQRVIPGNPINIVDKAEQEKEIQTENKGFLNKIKQIFKR